MFYQKNEVSDAFQNSGCWQQIVFNEFKSNLLSKSKPFPCIFGVSGFQTNRLMNIKSPTEVQVLKNELNIDQPYELIRKCLPKQGAVEVQNDAEGKEHSWHSHDKDETLIILVCQLVTNCRLQK